MPGEFTFYSETSKTVFLLLQEPLISIVIILKHIVSRYKAVTKINSYPVSKVSVSLLFSLDLKSNLSNMRSNRDLLLFISVSNLSK